MNVSRETESLLKRYLELLAKWNPRINLVAPATLADASERHVADCLQLIKLADSPASWADIGSGGGLPGLVIAIAYRDKPTNFTLIESDQRKCEFLRAAKRDLGLDKVTIIADRIEAILPLQSDLVSVRALAPLTRLMPYLIRHLASDGVALVMKGTNWQCEVAEAQISWNFKSIAHSSQTNSGAAILQISEISCA